MLKIFNNSIAHINRSLKQNQKHLVVPVNKMTYKLLFLLVKLGYITLGSSSTSINASGVRGRCLQQIILKTGKFHPLSIRGIQLLSNKSNQQFLRCHQLKLMAKQMNNVASFKTIILTTSQLGLCSLEHAIHWGIGGKILAVVY